MDCNEFSNMLFDKLEFLLKNSSQEKLLQQVFSGTLSNQLICKECPHGSETEEPFYTMGLEVSRQKNIIDSLKLFIQGEMLMGDNKYFCELCGKVNRYKEIDISTLCSIVCSILSLTLFLPSTSIFLFIILGGGHSQALCNQNAPQHAPSPSQEIRI